MIPLQAGNFAGSLCLLEKVLRMDSSPKAITKLSLWVQQNLTANLANVLALLNNKSFDKEQSILVELLGELSYNKGKIIS